MPTVSRLDFPLHHPSSLLCGKYLNEVPVLVMCPLQPMRSDMQNGNDLLKRQKKRDKANVKLCSCELRPGCRGGGLLVSWGGYAKFMCARARACVWFKRASRCAQTHISVLMHVCLCVCLFVYAIISYIRHYLVTAISPCHKSCAAWYLMHGGRRVSGVTVGP